MNWFVWLFPPLMIASPFLLTLAIRPRQPDAEKARRAGRLMRWLIGGTVIALLIWGGAAAAFGATPVRFLWALAFPLFALQIRLSTVRNEDWAPAAAAAPVRVASLENRAHASPIPGWAWAVPWFVAGVGVAAALLRLGGDELERGEMTRLWISVGVNVPIMLAFTAAGPWFIRMTLREPEPMDYGGSQALSDAYRRTRDIRAWAFYGLIVVMLALLAGQAAVLAWLPGDANMGATIGVVGGVLGSLVGLAGGAFGVWMSFRRARINRMLRELNDAAVPTEGDACVAS